MTLEQGCNVKKQMEIGVNLGFSNEEYHADRKFLSSSVIKTLYWDVKKYEDEYINGNKVQKNSNGMQEGTAIHYKILEPHLYDIETAIYPEMEKRGNAFKEFENNNHGKLILSLSQAMKVDRMFIAYNKRKEAVEMLNSCDKEYTICAEVEGVACKMRADAINIEDGFIADIKSTSYSAELEVFKENAYSQLLSYDISAALYTKIAEIQYGKPFDFYYIVISKKDYVCHIYKASQQSIINGRNKISKALSSLKYFREHGKWPTADIKKTFDSDTYEIMEL
jgi:hypothetical protein